jgi:hypothetical protein
VVEAKLGDELIAGAVRVIDDSGEDYLFDASRFVPIELTPAVAAYFGAAPVADKEEM